MDDLNRDLSLCADHVLAPYRGKLPELPPIFIVGPPRCGSTLFMQWLAATGAVACPSNMLSRFWAAPIVGARIQKLLTDPAYDFRGELQDLQADTDFRSTNGKTQGALSPHEFWYFWRRFFPGDDYQSRDKLEQTVDAETVRAELAGVTDVFERPFAAKGMIFNENIPFVADLLPNALFVWIRRHPEYNIQSILEARERQYGDMNRWYSFKIRDYPALSARPPLEAVSGQVAAIHDSIEWGVSGLPGNRVLAVDYERFCEDPAAVYARLAGRLEEADCLVPSYSGPAMFEIRNDWRLEGITREDAVSAYRHARKSRRGGTPWPDTSMGTS